MPQVQCVQKGAVRCRANAGDSEVGCRLLVAASANTNGTVCALTKGARYETVVVTGEYISLPQTAMQ